MEQITNQFLTLETAGQAFALNLTCVREIRAWSAVTPVPGAARGLMGVLNLRGNVLPVIDLALLLRDIATAPISSSVIVVAELHQQTAGLLVDSVSDIVTVDTTLIQQVSRDNGTWASDAITGVFTRNDSIVPILDPSRFAGVAQEAVGEIAA